MVTGQMLMFSTQYLWLGPSLSISGSFKLLLLLKGNWHLRAILTSFVQMEPVSQKHVKLLHSSQRHLCYLFTNFKMAHNCVAGWLCDTISLFSGYQNWPPFGDIPSIPFNIAQQYCQPRISIHLLSTWLVGHPSSLFKIQIMRCMTE